MPIARFEMPDGRIGRFEVPEGTSPEQAQQMIADMVSKGPVTEPVTPTEASDAASFFAGGASTSRGIVNKLFGKELDTTSFAGVPIDPQSGAYVGGTFIDPAAALIGGLTTKAASIPRVLAKTPVGQGIVGGGTGGALIGGLSPEQDWTLGGMTGGITGSVIGGAIPGVAGAFGKGIDRFGRGIKGEEVRAGRIMRELVGNEEIIADPSLTTAQATKNVVPELGALESEFKGYGGRDWAAKIAGQEASRRQQLGKFAGGESAEAVRSNAELAKKILNEGLDPLRVEGAEAANLNTKFFVELTKELNEKREQAAKAVETVRRAKGVGGMEQRAADLSVERRFQPGLPAGAPRLSSRYTYMDELSRKADELATTKADESLAAGEAARTAERRMEHTRAHGIAELNADQLIGKIDSMLVERGSQTNPVREKALSAVREQLSRFKDKNGNIDAYDLHGIRKNINDLISVTLPNADKATKNRAVAELSSVKKLIDDSIVGAGGQPLVNYFEKFSDGMSQIRQAQLVGEIMQMSEKKIIDLAEGNAPKKIEKLLGTGKYKVEDIGEAANTVKEIAARIKKDREIADKAQYGTKIVQRVIEENSPQFPRVNLLNRATQMANTAASAILEKLDDATRMALAKAAANPIEAIRVMNTTPLVEQEKAYLLRWMREAGKSGAMTGAATGGMMNRNQE